MLLKIFSVYDQKVGAYLPPFTMRTQAEAERAIETAVNSTDHDFHRYASDYTLHRLGVIDDTTGVITPEMNGPHTINVLMHYMQQAVTKGGVIKEGFVMPNGEAFEDVDPNQMDLEDYV